jgi:hypothetical protein
VIVTMSASAAIAERHMQSYVTPLLRGFTRMSPAAARAS